MFHKNYFEVEACDHFDLGFQLGKLFQEHVHASLRELKNSHSYSKSLSAAQKYFSIVQKYIPSAAQEVEGYAKGAKVKVIEMFLLAIEDEFSTQKSGRCTTMVTNRGKLIGHNEDWDIWAKDSLCLLRKKIKDTSILEFFYLSTLGGNSISYSSHRLLQAINSVSHCDVQPGIPKNIISRWLQESRDIENDLERLGALPRSSGHHHLLANDKNIYSVELSAREKDIRPVKSPFAHTNHYLGPLKELECEEIDFSYDRYRCATKYLQEYMSERELRFLMESSEQGAQKSLYNERTIGQMIINCDTNEAKVWMAREKERGWVTYPLVI